jgi:uncharacterized protein (TIGR02001 family)
VGLTTDYVFRGISQTNEEAAVQGGVDFSCGRFYGGVWASSFFGDTGATEIDIYGGFKHTTGPITWDVGLLYYSYPGSFDGDGDYFELKLGASGSPWKGGTVSGNLFFSPEYTLNTGETITYEVGLAHVFPNVGMFTPTFSALYGYTDFQDFSNLSYGYWNVGLTLGFLEKWSLDLRYWDTDNEGFAAGPLGEERFVGTIKYTF